jgi:hypothetical protein
LVREQASDTIPVIEYGSRSESARELNIRTAFSP